MSMDQAVMYYYKNKYKKRFVRSVNKIRGKSYDNV
jgi:hypothetical protein